MQALFKDLANYAVSGDKRYNLPEFINFVLFGFSKEREKSTFFCYPSNSSTSNNFFQKGSRKHSTSKYCMVNYQSVMLKHLGYRAHLKS